MEEYNRSRLLPNLLIILIFILFILILTFHNFLPSSSSPWWRLSCGHLLPWCKCLFFFSLLLIDSWCLFLIFLNILLNDLLSPGRSRCRRRRPFSGTAFRSFSLA